MRFHLRVLSAASLACGVAGCVTAPGANYTLGEIYGGESEQAARYSDFITARYAGVSDDPANAARYSRRAHERDPADAALLERAVVASLLAGEADEAAKIAQGATAAAMKQAPFASLTRIADDIEIGRTRPALARLQLGGLGDVNADASRYLSAWLASGDVNAAADHVTAESGRRPIGQGFAVAGLLLLAHDRPADALARFEEAWRRGDHTPAAVANFIALLARSNPDRAKQVLAQFRTEAGYDPAVEAALTRPPAKLTTKTGAALSLAILGHGILMRANPELATLYFSLALHVDPSLDPARIDLADSLRQQDRRTEALNALAEINAGSIYRAEASMAEAFLREELKDHDGALAAARAALSKVRPRDLLVQAGDLNRGQGRHAEAEALYNEAELQDAADKRADWRLLFARAAERDKLGRWQDAEGDIRRALELEPDRPELLNFLGFSFVQRGGDIRAGLDLIEKALARRPDQGYIVDSLGWAHYRLGEYEEAVTQLERAAELSPSDPEINDHLGDAYWRTDRRQDADYAWCRALQLDPPAELAASLRQKIESGLPAQSGARALAGAGQPNRP